MRTALTLLVTLAFAVPAAAQAQQSRPNVILIITDDVG
jgi:hypothetical protein